MKRTYVNRLPKNEEVKNTNVRIENGELVVEVEFKEKFEPKDGDFIYYKSVYSNATFICKYDETDKKSLGCYAAFQEIGDEKCWNFNSRKYAGIYECRYATAEEKTAFLERLEKECWKKWNSEKKCFEDVYVPKFGDIVRIEHPDVVGFKRKYVISIFPNKEAPQKFVNGFFDIASIDMEGNINIDDNAHSSYNYNHVFLASQSEREELFDKLSELGKRWNEETKQLEDIRWKPNDGDYYFFIDSGGKIKRTRNVSHWDIIRVSINNCFQTEEAAQPYVEKIKEIFKLKS